MHFRVTMFYIWIYWGCCFFSTFGVENSGDDAVLTFPFSRKMSFYLAVDFERLMIYSQQRNVTMIMFWYIFWFIFEFSWESFCVSRFDTGSWDEFLVEGHDFWMENLGSGGQILNRFPSWCFVRKSRNVSSCYFVRCHPRSRGDVVFVNTTDVIRCITESSTFMRRN